MYSLLFSKLYNTKLFILNYNDNKFIDKNTWFVKLHYKNKNLQSPAIP